MHRFNSNSSSCCRLLSQAQQGETSDWLKSSQGSAGRSQHCRISLKEGSKVEAEKSTAKVTLVALWFSATIAIQPSPSLPLTHHYPIDTFTYTTTHMYISLRINLSLFSRCKYNIDWIRCRTPTLQDTDMRRNIPSERQVHWLMAMNIPMSTLSCLYPIVSSFTSIYGSHQ